jgi:hypothetical protein
MTETLPAIPKKRKTGLIIALIAGLVLCGVAALGLAGAGGAVFYFGQATAQAGGSQTALAAQQQATAAAQAKTLTAQAQAATATAVAQSAADTATARAEAATATTGALYAASTATAQFRLDASTATAQARQTQGTPTVLVPAPMAQDWPLLVFDPFDSNVNKWPAGRYSDDYGSGNRSVTQGKYQWKATATEGRLWRLTYDNATVSDFYLAADFLVVSGGPQARYGLILRDDGSNYYILDVGSNQQFAFYMWYANKWTTLVKPAKSAIIAADGVNRLAALARGSQFTLFINDQQVAQTRDSHIAKGQTGFAINLTDKLDAVSFEFDSFELRAP